MHEGMTLARNLEPSLGKVNASQVESLLLYFGLPADGGEFDARHRLARFIDGRYASMTIKELRTQLESRRPVETVGSELADLDRIDDEALVRERMAALLRRVEPEPINPYGAGFDHKDPRDMTKAELGAACDGLRLPCRDNAATEDLVDMLYNYRFRRYELLPDEVLIRLSRSSNRPEKSGQGKNQGAGKKRKRGDPGGPDTGAEAGGKGKPAEGGAAKTTSSVEQGGGGKAGGAVPGSEPPEPTVSIRDPRMTHIGWTRESRNNPFLRLGRSDPNCEISLGGVKPKDGRMALERLLQGKGWTSGDVWNRYRVLLQAFIDKKGIAGRTAILHSLFIEGLMAVDHGNRKRELLKRGITKENLLEHRLIALPWHVGGNHWRLLSIHPSAGMVAVYDTIGEVSSKEKQRALRLLRDELCGTVLGIEGRKVIDWGIEQIETPRQKNSHDCGLWMIWMLRHLLEDIPLEWIELPAKAEQLRKHIVGEIVAEKLMRNPFNRVPRSR